MSSELHVAQASVPAPAALVSKVARPPAVRIDFAQLFRDHLLVTGWIFGLSNLVASACIRFDGHVFDLFRQAVRVPRPDVTQHISSPLAVDDEHGFCLLVALTGHADTPSSLGLSVALHSGESAESLWPVGRGEEPVAAFLKRNQPTLEVLGRHLEPSGAIALSDIMEAAGSAVAPSLPFQFEVDLCCLLEGRILLITGWMIDLENTVTAAQLSAGSVKADFLRGRVLTSRPDIDAKVLTSPGGAPLRLGFLFSTVLEKTSAMPVAEVVFEFTAVGRRALLRRPLSTNAIVARRELVCLLGKLEADAALVLIEHLADALEADRSAGGRGLYELLESELGRAVQRLPNSLEGSNPQFFLHLDRVVPVADAGVFLNGWFYAQPDTVARVACHCGFTAVDIRKTWVTHPRPDVTQHLIGRGASAADDDHGFACYVQLGRKGTPYFIAVTSGSGVVRRMRLPESPPAASALQTVRSVLTSFNVEHRALPALLGSQIGPAVQAAWSRRQKAPEDTVLHRYGPRCASPAVSVIVPLFGRYDLVEYQLALFADDLELRELELLYFVDDPAIYDPLRLQCADLYATFQVPFTLAFAGHNLGFAGANNCAARAARGRRLLLLNSDVFPKSPGWIGKLVQVYERLKDPGLLGAKLLYEDGSVQHAGIAFRPHPPWSDMWINYHPHKGQSPLGLHGVREVEAVTAACALVDADLYRDLGGLSEEYIVGDFEDSDLCLRAAAAGRRNRVALDIELYHLERQSQDRIGDAQWRTNLTVYNCWQHHQRWAARIGGARA